MMLKEIYTFGYGNCTSIEPLLFLVNKYKIDLIVDVRARPRAWTPRWSAPYLSKQLGNKYTSITELGNTSGNAKWIPPDLEEANKKMIELCKMLSSVVLVCAEKDYRQCHRTEVAEKLSALTCATVRHLSADEALSLAV